LSESGCYACGLKRDRVPGWRTMGARGFDGRNVKNEIGKKKKWDWELGSKGRKGRELKLSKFESKRLQPGIGIRIGVVESVMVVG